jgi:hypothetical protein
MAFRLPQNTTELETALSEARYRGWMAAFETACHLQEARLHLAWAAITQLEMI